MRLKLTYLLLPLSSSSSLSPIPTISISIETHPRRLGPSDFQALYGCLAMGLLTRTMNLHTPMYSLPHSSTLYTIFGQNVLRNGRTGPYLV